MFFDNRNTLAYFEFRNNVFESLGCIYILNIYCIVVRENASKDNLPCLFGQRGNNSWICLCSLATIYRIMILFVALLPKEDIFQETLAEREGLVPFNSLLR